MLIFITGGVRSGKSAFAEQLALQYGKGKPQIHYIATSVPYDDEMDERVRRHREDRSKHPISFITHEISLGLEEITNFIQDDDVVLIDCLTTLLNNEMFEGWQSGHEAWKSVRKRAAIFTRLVETFTNFQSSKATFIVVSNEILNDCIPNDESTFYYMSMLGRLHQELVHLCKQAIVVEYGIAIFKKDV